MTDEEKRTGTVVRRPRPGGGKALEELVRGGKSEDDAVSGSESTRRLPPSDDERMVGRPSLDASVHLPSADLDLTDGQARNPYIAASAQLVGLIARIGDATDLAADAQAKLRRRASELVTDFRRRLSQAGVSNEQAEDATFCLCAYVDQSVLDSPWGRTGSWASSLLRVEFFSDVDINRRLESIVSDCRRDAAAYHDLGQFVFMLLSLGLETSAVSYRSVKESLPDAGRLPEAEGNLLSARWEGTSSPVRVVRQIPVWVVGVTVVGILLFAYTTFRFSLNAQAEPVLAELSRIGFDRLESPGLSLAISEDRSTQPELRQLLANEIAANLLEVSTSEFAQTIYLNAVDLFPSGSAEPSQKYRQLLASIANALSQMSGRVDVIGHTDDVPIRSLRYQSNTELSYARAANIAREIRNSANNIYVVHVGRGSSEPLCNDQTSACRARNRRVEILYREG